MAAKNFLDDTNPMYRFIGSNAAEQSHQERKAEHTEQSHQEQKKEVAAADERAQVPEVKSRRVQIVLQPTLYERAKEKAAQDNTSFNEIVHRALKAYLG